MIAAVTGGTGFIGDALIARLARAREFEEIRVLSRQQGRSVPVRIRWFRGDLAAASGSLGEFLSDATVVFHCAGESRRTNLMRGLNVEGTRRLIDAAAGRVRRWVQLSSVGAYGRRIREGIVDERSAINPEGEYETTKVEADDLVQRASSAGAFTAVTLRPSIVFGLRMPNNSLEQLVSAVRRGLYVHIGSKPAIANYVYVDDVADALLLLGISPRASGCYILSDDRSLAAFVGAIATLVGRPPPAWRVPEAPLRLVARLAQRVPGSPLTETRIDALTRSVLYPSMRIREELGYVFSVSIEEGLRRFVASLRSGK